MATDGTEPHCDPLTILRFRFGSTCTFYLQGVDAARRVVTVTMVQLRLIAGRKFLFLVSMRCAAEIDPTVSAPTTGIADAGFRIEFEVVEFLERGEVPLAPVANKDSIDDFPCGLVFELVLPPAIKVTTVKKLDPTICGNFKIRILY